MVSIKKIWPAALLSLAFILAWQPALSNGFVYWDDFFQIMNNVFVKSLTWSLLPELFTPRLNILGMYQPLATLFFGLEYKIFGQNALAFHALNLLWHALNVWLVYLLVKKISGAKIAYGVAGLWAILPVNAETVNWLSALSTLLSTGAGLAALIFYIKYLQERRRALLFLVYAFFILALLSKVSAIILPILMLALDWLINHRLTIKDFYHKTFLWLLSLAAGLIGIIIRQESHLLNDNFPDYNLLDKITLVFYSLGAHLTKIFAPLNLYYPYEYPHQLNHLFSGEIYIYALLGLLCVIIVGLSATTFKIFKNRTQLFWLLWFIICLFPMLKFTNSSTPILADRYLYLASLGPLAILFSWLQTLPAKYYRLISIGLIGLALIFICISRRQSAIWHDDFTVWNYSLSQNPNSVSALGMLGQLYLVTGRLATAQTYYEQALVIVPQDKILNNNLGLICLKLQNSPCALKSLRLATAGGNDHAEPWQLRAQAELADALFNEALSSINQALVLDPLNGENYHLKALINLQLKQNTQACTNLAKAANLGYNEAEKLIQQICPSKPKTP